MGSRACAANHYVIVEKCGYPEMYVHIFGERRFSEQLPIWGSLWLSENCRNAPGMTLLKIATCIIFMFTTSERRGDIIREIFIFKPKVSCILCLSSLIVCCGQTF